MTGSDARVFPRLGPKLQLSGTSGERPLRLIHSSLQDSKQLHMPFCFEVSGDFQVEVHDKQLAVVLPGTEGLCFVLTPDNYSILFCLSNSRSTIS